MSKIKNFVFPTLLLGALILSGCSSSSSRPKAPPAPPVLLKFIAAQDFGLVVHPVDWFRGADQDNPGVDCTLKLETQGPPENVYSCVVKDERNVFIVKIFETYQVDLNQRELSKITVDSKWASTRDLWIEALRKASFKESSKNPIGSRGTKWEFSSPDGTSTVNIFWNQPSNAVTVHVLPRVKVPPTQ